MKALQYFSELPFSELKRAVHFIRRNWFSRSIPQAPGLLLEIDPHEFEDILKKQYHYERVDKYSFHFDGEIVNVRTPYGVDSEGRQRENHIRLFEIDHEKWECFCLVHHETSRFQHWDDHVNSVDLSWDRGIEITTNITDDLDVDYNEVMTSEAYREHHGGEIPDRFK